MKMVTQRFPHLRMLHIVLALLCVLFTDRSMAQNTVHVTGKVSDEKEAPVVGASVVLTGHSDSPVGTTTDNAGHFALDVPRNATLSISFIGYVTEEVVVGDKTQIDIVLKEEAQMMDDVIVIGYGTVKSKEMTSAVSHVSSKDFAAIGTNNALMQIQGKVASVSIGNSAAGDPNSSPSIQIRGVSSREAGLEPLIVIDGMPGGDMNNVNPVDIASIDILKDGAASAIYGTRGSNGVILVTTKSGTRDGKLTVSYNGYVTVDRINNKPELLSADEFRKLRVGTGVGKAPDFGASTDWFDEITQTGLAHSHAVTLSGGTRKMSYRATVDIRDAHGVDIRSYRNEYGGRIQLNHGAPDDLLRFSVSIAPRVLKYDYSDQNAFSTAMRANPTYPVMDPDDPSLYSQFAPTLPTGPNPVEVLRLVESGAETKLLDWNASGTLNLIPLLGRSLAERGTVLNTQIQLSQHIQDNFDYSFAPSTYSVNRQEGIDGTAGRTYSKYDTRNLEWLINARHSFGDHNLGLMLAYSYNYSVSSGLWGKNRNFPSDALQYNNLGAGDNEIKEDPTRVGMGTNKYDNTLIGFVGRITYDYKHKYLFTASLRRDGSSRFGTNHKWGNFPAVSAAWRISEENFMQQVKWIDELKLRGDFGITGNQNFANYVSLSTYGSYGYLWYNGSYVQTIGPDKNINPDLRWEKGINWNVGLDFSLFDGIFTGSLNYYNRTQKDLLGDYEAPMPSNIHQTIKVNVGSMKNSGLEAEFHIRAARRKNFNYDIDLAAEWNKNEFVSFSSDVYKGRPYSDVAALSLGDFGVQSPTQRMEEGHRIGSFYLYRYAGIDHNGNWLAYDKTGKKILLQDATEEDRAYAGNGLPKVRMSMTHTFRYKNWDLTASLRGAFFFDVLDATEMAFSVKNAMGGYNVYKKAYTHYGAIEDSLGKPTDYWLRRGDYLKLDVVTLGYNFRFRNNRFIEGLRLYTTGRNLFTFKGYEGMDPDMFPANGLTPGVILNTAFYPSTTQFLFGVQITFK